MAGGAFRGGHMRPTFDTPVEFISVNQTATDKSGGYGSPQVIRGEWGAPVVMTETTAVDRDDFVPTGDSGVQATNIGMFAWYTEGDTQTLFFQSSFGIAAILIKTRSNGGTWSTWTIIKANAITNSNANRARSPLPNPTYVVVENDADANIANNLPNIITPTTKVGILIDDATGQSLYYCNAGLTPPRCEHYRRAIDDGLGPASRTYMADVKDIAGSERVIGDINVATTTKSLVFAHATLRPLLESGSLAKDWKVRIGGRDMDITQVMDGWVPNRYARLVVEDRS